MSKKNTTLQSVRASSIKHQLNALVSQVEAIKKLDCEHNDGIDLGANPELVNILYFSRRLASRTDAIVKAAAARDAEGVASLLNRIRGDVTYLSEHAAEFQKHAKTRAENHLNRITENGAELVNAPPTNVVESSYVQAGLSCFRAESNQCRTFEFQVLALVYLALEIAYFAADEVGVKPIALPAPTNT